MRQAFGAVAVPRAAWWSVSLSVPIGADDDTRRGAQLRLVRHGPSNGPPSHGQQIELELPCAELDAVLTLLVGVVSQARRDGVIR